MQTYNDEMYSYNITNRSCKETVLVYLKSGRILSIYDLLFVCVTLPSY